MGLLDGYDAVAFRDEALKQDGSPRPYYGPVLKTLDAIGAETLARRGEARELIQRSRGVTFTLAGEGTERTFPLDVVPRIIAADEWTKLEAGLRQRVKALNAFLCDVYGEQQILNDGIVPWPMVLSSPQLQRSAWGIRPPHGIHVHVAGLDLVRGDDGRWQVLEDNLRVPSGASYVLENREVLARVLPELFGSSRVRPVDHYPALLREALRTSAPPSSGDDPQIVLLTPGAFNSAYFEHTLLARQMGVPLVEGSDLFTESDRVYMRTTRGRKPVDVIYRRIDDEFIDPLALRPDSLLGCPGVLNAARAGMVTIANAIGNGVADDKAMFAYVPAMIRYYLSEEPLLASVPTFICEDPEQRAEVLDRLEQLVVKPVDASGGYGMLIGPTADEKTRRSFARKIRANPRGFIAQEIIRLTRHPTLCGDVLEPRHVDLRPFIVQGSNGIEVLPGGLTRVALVEGSLVVNSSQGGGSKDTWVLQGAPKAARPSSSPSGDGVRRAAPPMRGSKEPAALGAQQPQQQQGGSPC